MAFREKELMQLRGTDERWENFMQFTSGLLMPYFTEFGFKVVQAPAELQKKLFAAVRNAVDTDWDDLPYEREIDAIYHPEGYLPKFVRLPGGLAQQVHRELLPAHEEWAGGMKLRPTSIYGVRLYQNGSALAMHHDKCETHVISSIFHIDHDEDSEPWPIDIEDHDGKLHSVVLERGQMLFYESAKCLHGRMKQCKGKYYGSIFIHYMPVDKKIWDWSIEDVIAAVPPHWRKGCTHQHGSRWAGQAITTGNKTLF
jgi:hypothetical protein